MAQVLDLTQSIMSPLKEMSAYETLWAMDGIKEKKLQELFKQYTPTETLKEISNQIELFQSEKSPDKIQEEVNKFLNSFLHNKLHTFSIVVSGNFQYPKSLKDNYPIGLFYYKGNLDILDAKKCISIVGARKASPDGLLKARKLSKELTAENLLLCLV